MARAPTPKKNTAGADLAQVISLLLGLKKVRFSAAPGSAEDEDAEAGGRGRDPGYAAEVAALMGAHPELFPAFPFSGKELRERLDRTKSLDRIVELLRALLRSAQGARRGEIAQALEMADLAMETLANAQAHKDTEEGTRASIAHLAAGPLAKWRERTLPQPMDEEEPEPEPAPAPERPQDPGLAALREALMADALVNVKAKAKRRTKG